MLDQQRLIEEVGARSILYNTTDPFYKDNARKERAWADVAEAMEVDAELCKAKWKTLRDVFVKNKRKASTNALHKDWKFNDIMSFLSPHIQARSSKGSQSGSCADEEDSATPPSFEEQARDTPSAAMRSAEGHTGPSWRDRPARSRSPRDRGETQWRDLNPSIEDRFLSMLQESDAKPETETDECYHFALSLVPLLVKLDPNQRHKAKIEILNALHGAKSSAPAPAQMESHHAPTPPMNLHLDMELSGHMSIPHEQTSPGHLPRSAAPSDRTNCTSLGK